MKWLNASLMNKGYLVLLTIPLFNCLTTKVGIVLVCPVNNVCVGVGVGVESVVHYSYCFAKE